MHEEILSSGQIKLIPLLKNFSNNFGLIGGTAVALLIGHRRSIDFDLATTSQLQSEKVRSIIRQNYSIDNISIDEANELTLVVNGVKMTYLHYPFVIKFEEDFHDSIQMPDLLTLAAMKAFALGRRAKWKDYVDLFFIINKYSFRGVVNRTREIFGNEFNEKLFREQLAYYKDIDYSETIDYMPGFELENIRIQEALEEISLQK